MKAKTQTGWSPQSWRDKPILQVPTYKDQQALKDAEQLLASYPQLIAANEAEQLKQALAQVAHGEAFLLQGGDCAESFDGDVVDHVTRFFRIFLQMAVVLTHGVGKPVVKVGRIAGQFAKPRSSDVEHRDGMALPSFRGDIVNDIAFTPEAREPDPVRMITAYKQSSATLNFIRAMVQSGYADLAKAHSWTMDFVRDASSFAQYQGVAEKISDAIDFMRACGITSDKVPGLGEIDFYSSHEALLLVYEEALTRRMGNRPDQPYYATSGHMLWIGDRTRDSEGAHVAYFSGIANPIGIKCGPSMQVDDLKKLLDTLNPEDEAGRITLICRFGADKVADHLPKLIDTVKREGRTVVWSCDPMHGNTVSTANGYKTRQFDRILKEVHSFFDIHRSSGTYAGGIHVEMTGADVTECTGGGAAITEVGLEKAYVTKCDPRLNADQSLELAFLVADKLSADRRGDKQEPLAS